MKHAALYVRVSTEEQRKHGLSVDNQIDALIQYCRDNGIEYYKLYNDAGISGHISYRKRPALLKLIKDCQQGEVSGIYFTRIDRWFRSIKDYFLVQELIGDVPWRAIWEEYNTEDANGRLMVHVLLSVSEAEASRTGEKVRSVLQYKKSIGEYCGRVPLGFKDDGKKHLIVNEDERKLVDEIFRTYQESLSLKKTYAEFPDISQTGIRKMLHNPVYIGTYITEAEHKRIAEHMKQHIHSGGQYPYPFVGMIRCPKCSKFLLGTSSHERRYYRCTNCHGFQIAEPKIERMVVGCLEPELEKLKLVSAESEKGATDNSKKIAELERKSERLKDLYIDGEIDKDEYQKRKVMFESQITELKPAESDELPELPRNWREAYDGLNEQNKRIFWRTILKEIHISEDKKVCSLFFV